MNPKHTFCQAAFIGILILLIANLAYSDEPDVDKKKALQAELEHSLVAPCCWNMTVDQHESGASRQVRAEISRLIDAGKTKNEILLAMTTEYGERILATPAQDNLLGKMAYWLIPFAILVGAVLVGISIKRFAKPGSPKKAQASKTQKSGPPQSDWDARVEEELKRFD